MIFLLRHSTKLHIFGAARWWTDLADDSRFFLRGVGLVPFCESGFAQRLTRRKLIMVCASARWARRSADGWRGARGGCLRGLLAVRESCKMICSRERCVAGDRGSQNTAQAAFCLLECLTPLANARETRVSLATERRPVRGEGPLGEDGCSSAARQCWWRARLDVMPHTGQVDGASRPASPVIPAPAPRAGHRA